MNQRIPLSDARKRLKQRYKEQNSGIFASSIALMAGGRGDKGFNWNDYLDDDRPRSERVGKQNGRAPHDNQKQNAQTNRVAKDLNLSKKQSEELHREIGHRGLSYTEVLDIAKELFDKQKDGIVMKNEDIKQYLGILIGKPLLDIGRASNMLWLGFGTPLETTDHNGKSYLKSSISLHVQSTWRISNKEEKLIKFASSDMYTPNSNIKWSEDFNWDVQGINLFDEKSREWLNNNQGLCVKDCRINCWGDLLLLFTNSDKLEIFVDVTDESECWRLFEQDSKKEHFVVTGQGVIF